MTEISILGCGWLGLPLAKSLLKKGHPIKGSTTSADKLELLRSSGLEPFLISVSENEIIGNIRDFLRDAKIVIIDIPPKISTGNFVRKAGRIVDELKLAKVEHVIFISSISVYGKQDGVVTENTLETPNSENGKQILEAENLFRSASFQTTILRLGGLIGQDRHPVKHMAGKRNLADPGAPINLIHLQDCIGIIEAIIAKDIWGETFNAVAPFHPTRKSFYIAQADKLSLPLPSFVDEIGDSGKVVSSDKIVRLLDYTFLGL